MNETKLKIATTILAAIVEKGHKIDGWHWDLLTEKLLSNVSEKK